MEKIKHSSIQYFLVLGVVFILTALAVAIPSVWTAIAGNSSTFNVSLTLNNDPPTIPTVSAISDSPAEDSTKYVTFYFNATDTNGVADIPGSNANITINQSGVTLYSEPCVATAKTGTTNEYECNVSVNYYHLPGAWDINASIFDGGAALAEDLTVDLSMGTTYGITLSDPSLTFSGDPAENDVNASNNPQTVTNKGNAAFGQLDLKAYDIVSGSDYIGAGNFSGATTDTPSGQTLINNSDVALSASTVAVQGTRDVFIYLDIPSGTPEGTYGADTLWVMTAS